MDPHIRSSRMQTLQTIPDLHLLWEGIGEYNGGFLNDFEIDVSVDPATNTITFTNGIEGAILTPEQANEFYLDIVSASIATVVQERRRNHPFRVSTRVSVEMAGLVESDLPIDKMDELLEWLRCALNIRPYNGNPDAWEL